MTNYVFFSGVGLQRPGTFLAIPAAVVRLKAKAYFIVFLILCCAAARANDCFRVYALVVESAIAAQITASWNSRYFYADRVTSENRARAIVATVFHDSAAQQELAAFIDTLGGMASPELWNLYFAGPYDRAVGYSDGYRDLMLTADRALPTTGRIADYGTGTGNFASFLRHRQARRDIVALDTSAEGLASAKRKLELVCAGLTGFLLHACNLAARTDSFNGQLQGGVMNNVLYAIPPAQRPQVLRQIHQDLAHGATFVLNDPLPTAHSPAEVQRFITEIAVSAVRNGSPMSERDLALLAHINLQKLTTPSSAFMTSEQLQSLAREAGFEVVSAGTGYYGMVSVLVLRRP